MRDHYPKIAIIGAGISGIACARKLREFGHDNVAIFDKARGPGGRLSTRREGSLRFDHGAQYFTIRRESFAETMRPLRQAGNVVPWEGRFMEATKYGAHAIASTETRWVGNPRMSSIPRAMIKGIETKYEIRVGPLARHGDALELHDDGGHELGHFDFVICTAPAPQTCDLIRPVAPALAARVEDEVEMLPCWAAMMAFETTQTPGFDSCHWGEDFSMSWLARNSSKPGRDGADTWILHASSWWSRDHLEASFDEAAELLWDEVSKHFDAEPTFFKSHRWRYAMVEKPLGVDALQSKECPALFIAGDWCRHARIEAAFQSGQAAAQLVSQAIR